MLMPEFDCTEEEMMRRQMKEAIYNMYLPPKKCIQPKAFTDKFYERLTSPTTKLPAPCKEKDLHQDEVHEVFIVVKATTLDSIGQERYGVTISTSIRNQDKATRTFTTEPCAIYEYINIVNYLCNDPAEYPLQKEQFNQHSSYRVMVHTTTSTDKH
eukprot:1355043-Amphidinium_carterae.2